MTARLSGAYRYVLNQGGQIAAGAYMDPTTKALVPGFFPYLTVAGVDFNAELGYHITPSWEARFGVNLKRYFYAMNSQPPDIAARQPGRGRRGRPVRRLLVRRGVRLRWRLAELLAPGRRAGARAQEEEAQEEERRRRRGRRRRGRRRGRR